MSIILHPEFEKLKNRLSDLLFEHDELQFNICPSLERRYLLNFGFLEFELYKKDVELSKLKRKFQLMQIQVNNEEMIDMNHINEILDKEFLEYDENLKKHMKDLEKARDDSNYKTLSVEEQKRLKSIYKKCVFSLHPDLNENLSDYEKELFIQINDAFKHGDLTTVEALYYSIPDGEIEPVSDEDRLKELIREMEDKIKKVKESFPYNKKELLENAELSEMYKYDLKQLMEQFDSEIQKYNDKISELI